MIILSVDTSGSSLSVALIDDGMIVSEMMYDSRITHSKRLLSFIDQTLSLTGYSMNNLDALTVTSGPGSFTGLRIGVSTVKGLADSLQKPIISVSSLDALAYQASFSECIVLPLIDARRGELYHASYTFRDGELAHKTTEAVSSPASVIDSISSPVVILGTGASAYLDVFKKELGEKVHFGTFGLNHVRAGISGQLAYRMVQEGKHEGMDHVNLSYIRKSDAEINFTG